MAKVSQDTIELIKNQVDIVDVVRHYIPVHKKGKNFVAICPFHADSNPSLSISTEKQIYKCFVCGAGGNVFTFVQNYQKVSFIDALKVVSDYGGLDVPDLQQTTYVNPFYENHRHLYDVNQKVSEYYQYNLTTAQGLEAMNYLSERQMDKTLIDHFKIGFAPSIQSSMNYLSRLNEHDSLLDVDLLYESSNGNTVPRFIQRLIFPIEDDQGYIIGFSGRMIHSGEGAKYVNTAETALFKKNQVLYHLSHAKSSIRQTGVVYLVEGFMDVIAFYKAGIQNVVATMGTALTKEHIQKIKRYAKEVIIVYDSDRAGKEATMKALEAFSQAQFRCHAVSLEGKLDPDEYLNQYGKERFIQALSEPMNIIDFAMSHEYSKININNHDDLKSYAMKMIRYLSDYGDDFAVDRYIHVLSQTTHFKEETLRHYFSPKQDQFPKSVELVFANVAETKYERAEKLLLYYMMHFKRAADLYQRDLGFLYFDLNSLVANMIVDYYSEHEQMNAAALLTKVEDQRIIDLITTIEFSVHDKKWNEPLIIELIRVIKDYAFEMKIIELKQEMKETNDINEKTKIGLQIASFYKQLKE